VEFPALERLEQLANSLDELQAQLNGRVAELRSRPVEVSSDDGAVRVTVDHAGRVSRVEVGAPAMRYSPAELSARITATIQRAQREAATRLQDSVREVLGGAADHHPVD
jgi:DNA-binding protein YbaB